MHYGGLLGEDVPPGETQTLFESFSYTVYLINLLYPHEVRPFCQSEVKAGWA